jgi:F0F1-type ATP synthase epsilon subunit
MARPARWMDKILLEIVTPKGRALSVSADEVTAPSVDGEFGVLPGHLPLLAALRTGLVTYRVGGETKKCAVGPGFAEAGPDKVVDPDRRVHRARAASTRSSCARSSRRSRRRSPRSQAERAGRPDGGANA